MEFIPKNLPYYIINCKDQHGRNMHMLEQMNKTGITNYHIVEGVENTISHVGCSLSHRKAIEMAEKDGYDKFIILEDDIVFNINQLNTTLELPNDADGVYVGISKYGLSEKRSDETVEIYPVFQHNNQMENIAEIYKIIQNKEHMDKIMCPILKSPDNPTGSLDIYPLLRKNQYTDKNFAKLDGMLSTHGICYMSKKFTDEMKIIIDDAVKYNIPHDVLLAARQKSLNVYAMRKPLVYQHWRVGGVEFATNFYF